MIQVNTTLAIDGTFYPNFESIELHQSIHNHHFFRIVIDHEVVENRREFTLNQSSLWLGKPVVITFDDVDFLGYITQVALSQQQGHEGDLVLTGFSPTIMLEAGNHTQSWLEKDLDTIVEKLMADVNITPNIAAQHSQEIPFLCQYNESHFNFLKRIANDFNEVMYYDGKELIFGKIAPANEVAVEYGRDLNYIDISVQALPTKYKHIAYNAEEHKDFIGEQQTKGKGLNELGYQAWQTAQNFFTPVVQRYAPAYVNDKGNSNHDRDREEQALSANANKIKAVSSKQGLQLAGKVKIKSAKLEQAGSFKEENYGEYLITQISHYAEGNGVYRNEFEAISGGMEVFPHSTDFERPIVENQLAEVIENNDPLKIGRVQVLFPWMKGSVMKSPFLRVMSPDAGSSDIVATNRGFMFVPEIGDQVMVGFEQNDPSKPFVLGSMFHGKNGSGGSDENKTKSITTRSGSTITFDDNAEKGNITIKDAAGNVMVLDGNGAVSVSANATISLSTGESSLTMKSDGTITIAGKDISISGSQTTSMATDSTTFNTDATTASVNGTKVEVNGTNTVTVNGQAKSTVSSSGTTSIEGTIIKLN